MSHIRHYRVLPWPTRPLTSLESIAKASDQQVAKTGQIVYFLSSFHHDSTTTAEGITTNQTRKNSINHWVLYSLLIVIVELELFCSDSQALRCYCLVLYRHFVRITLFIETTPPEAQLNTCSDTVTVIR